MPSREPAVLAVREVNRAARTLLEGAASDVWVEGEVRELTRGSQGHVYFTLGDATATLRCVMYRSDVERLLMVLEVGLLVRVRGGLTLYEARGAFQLVARTAVDAGEGEQARRRELLRKRLAAEGLFDPMKKRPLPPFPRTIGVVTSRDGAALRDIVRVALDRFPARLVVVHALVQGDDAPRAIVRALAWVQKVRTLDVIILARGGGATEDLRAFDDEDVVRAVAACRVPVVTGVGHEVDVTLVDLAADLRAATPSNAAERVVPDRRDLELRLETLERRLERAMDEAIDARRVTLERRAGRLRDPGRLLATDRQQLAQLTHRLHDAMARHLGSRRGTVQRLEARLVPQSPRARVARDREALVAAAHRLERALAERLAAARLPLQRGEATLPLHIGRHLGSARLRLQGAARSLQALSPLAVLDRGYAIVLTSEGRAVRSSGQVSTGESLEVRLARGRLRVRVEGSSQ